MENSRLAYILCRDFFNSLKPQDVSCHESSPDLGFDRAAHHRKVKEWFMNSVKFCQKIDAEQCKHAGICLYHLYKSHLAVDCNVKKDYDKLLLA